MRFNLDKSERSYGQVRVFEKLKEDVKAQLLVYVIQIFDEFIHLLNFLNFSIEKLLPFSQFVKCNVL